MAEPTEKLIDLAVPAAAAGERADVFLHRSFPEVSRSRIQLLLKQGFITASGRKLKPSEKLQAGQVLRGKMPLLRTELTVPPMAIDLDVVFEDEHLVVVNKPAGLTVHPGAGGPEPTVAAGLVYRYESLPESDPIRPGIVHRLDKQTSGLLVCAKSHRAMAGLSDQFRAKTAGRKYLALVDGVPPWNQKVVDNVLVRDPKNRLRFTVASQATNRTGEGKRAISRFVVTKIYGHRLALIEAELATGRTHQIRVHLSHLGYGIVGDRVYHHPVALPLQFPAEIRTLVWELDRQMLHAQHLSFQHPVSGIRMEFEASPPEPMAALLTALEAFSVAG